MIQQNELIMLLLGIACMIFLLLNKQKVKRIPVARTLVAGFCMLLAGYVFTIIEGILWNDFLNVIEHMCYTASSLFLAVWCWKVFHTGKGVE
jgi:vacuolar-type H+-ATPase subunit I/STV1